MAEKNITEAAETLSNAVRESQQAMVERTLAAHRQTAHVTQNLVEQGIEAARSQVEDNKSLLEELVRESQQPYKAAQAIITWTMTAQERNARLTRRMLEQGMEVFKSQAESGLALNQQLVEQSQKQIAAWQTLAQASLDATVALWSAPFSFYKDAFEHQS